MKEGCTNKIPIQLLEPIEAKDRWITIINVPCGKCVHCIQRRKAEWSFRMEQEMEISKTAYFVTLTYSQEHVPINDYGIKTLSPNRYNEKGICIGNDLTLFIKRIRQNQLRTDITKEHLFNNLKYGDPIKYYAAGEYGELRKRPHYHLIMFNVSESVIQTSWTLGQVHIVKANKYSIQYVMKYLDKHMGKKQDSRKIPEFNTMSEGIGETYIERNMEWHRRNLDILFVTTKSGIKVPMPKYYRLKIFDDDMRKKQVEIVENEMDKIKKEELSKYGPELYNYIKKESPKVTERLWRKKIKKRNVD